MSRIPTIERHDDGFFRFVVDVSELVQTWPDDSKSVVFDHVKLEFDTDNDTVAVQFRLKQEGAGFEFHNRGV